MPGFGSMFGGARTCPTGQSYSLLLEKCIPSDNTGTQQGVSVESGESGGSPANQNPWYSGSNIGGYLGGIADVINAVGGNPSNPDTVYVQQPAAPVQKTGSSTIWIALGVLILLIFIVILLKKK